MNTSRLGDDLYDETTSYPKRQAFGPQFFIPNPGYNIG
jgi:hypothetical protein